MKYKIQLMTAKGWADLKETEDDLTYHVSLFDTWEDAKAEKKDLDYMGYQTRIVMEDVEAEFDLY